jgi:hypothetical protein
MNADEHGWKMLAFFLVLAIGAVILAVALLYLQDRYRSYRGVSNYNRVLAEKKGMAAWQAFFLAILVLGSLFSLFAAEGWPQRIGLLVFTSLLTWYAVASLRAYFRLKG